MWIWSSAMLFSKFCQFDWPDSPNLPSIAHYGELLSTNVSSPMWGQSILVVIWTKTSWAVTKRIYILGIILNVRYLSLPYAGLSMWKLQIWRFVHDLDLSSLWMYVFLRFNFSYIISFTWWNKCTYSTWCLPFVSILVACCSKEAEISAQQHKGTDYLWSELKVGCDAKGWTYA
jgi:hypothetical protein